jgi:Amino acid transporters
MQNQEKHYGLLTATTMIIGIVIGSGIFFKSDDVLMYTGGSIWLGVLMFCIGAFSIIFGSLSLSELSSRTRENGGVVGYFEDFISKKSASGFGWFQTMVYFPTINAVVAWVAGIYTCSLLGINQTLEIQIFIGFLYLTLFHLINTLSLRLGGHFQNISTIIKLIPLLGIALISIFWAPSDITVPEGVKLITRSSVGLGWLAALAPIAFSFDGWVVATSVSNEVENPKRNMPLALTIGPLIVLGVYVLYFLGLNKMLGPEYIMSMGNDAVKKAGELLLGSYGSKIILVFVTIAIMGVVNGLTLGNIRMPQALASKKMIPFAGAIEKIDEKYQLSVWSCLVSFLLSVFWLFIHYVTQKNGILRGGDISEISIVFSYVCYTFLYLRVIKLKKDGEIKSVFKGIVCPVLATMGAATILVGGIMSNPVYAPIFIVFCLLVFMAGILYYRENRRI